MVALIILTVQLQMNVTFIMLILVFGRNYHLNLHQRYLGNAGSILIGNEWKFICASGYANNSYLYQTEIFTENVVLAINDENKIDNFKISISPIPVQNILNIPKQKMHSKRFQVYNLLGKSNH